MHSFARLISLPLLLGTMNAVAFAETVTPEQATELLAKSQTMDSKCSFLNSVQHSELSNLVARAEIALATQQSVAIASAALARGKALGKEASCVDSESAEVSGILAAAKTASLQAPKPVAQMAAVEPQPVAALEQPADPVAEPAMVVETKMHLLPQQVKKVAVKPLKPTVAAGLGSYASLTQRYYLQRRCGTMGSHAINALYQNVVATHQRTLQAFGVASTAAAMRRAEALAAQQTCN